ncbi:hypothetical protein OQA88_3308 [Cercophora sp. LCS_1]
MDDDNSFRRSRRGYKPVPLRWPFLLAQMMLLAAAITAVTVLYGLMPDSDDSAYIDGRRRSRMARAFDIATPRVQRRDGSLFNISTMAVGRPTPAVPTPAAPIFEMPVGQFSPAPTENTPTLVVVAPAAPADPVDSTQTVQLDLVPVGPGLPATSLDIFTAVQFGPDYTEPVTILVTAALDGFVAGKKPKKAKATVPITQEIIPVNSVWISYDTTAATTSTEPVVRGSTDYVRLGADPTIVLTETPEPTDAQFGVKNVVPETEVLQTVVTTLGASLSTVVTTPPPRTVVSVVEATVLTIMSTLQPTTAVVTRDGAVVTSVFAPVQTMVSTVDRSLVTMVQSRPPETVVLTTGGVPVTLVAVIAPAESLAAVTETLVSVIGGTRVTVTPQPTTITTVTGGQTLTLTSTPPAYVTTTGGKTTTMTRVSTSAWPFTTIITTNINGTPTTVSLTLAPTPTVNPSNDNGTRIFPALAPAEYFAGTFLPTLFAVILALPIAVIDLNAKLFQPFQALARDGGSPGPDTLILRYGGILSIVTPAKQLLDGHPVPFLTTTLMLLSWLMAPLAAEAIGVKVHGVCSHLSISGCAIAVGVSPWPARILIAVMVIMLLLMIALATCLHRWDTGLDHNPWSLADIAILSRHPDLRARLAQMNKPTEAELDRVFRSGRFHLGPIPHDTEKDILDAAIIPNWDEPTPTWPLTSTSTTISSPKLPPPQAHRSPFPALTYTCRTTFILLLLGLISLLAYYHLSRGDTPFELFMDSQTFGVKFLFAALGSIFSLFWGSFFISVASLSPFLLPVNATLIPPTNAFSGIYNAVKNRQWLLLAAGVMAVLAELLPVLLANIPYALTQTFGTHTTCTYLALVILGAMVMVLGGSLLVKWPDLPVDPRTLAGAAFYALDLGEGAERVKDSNERRGYKRAGTWWKEGEV